MNIEETANKLVEAGIGIQDSNCGFITGLGGIALSGALFVQSDNCQLLLS